MTVADVIDTAAVDAAIATAVERFGRLDVLIAAAALGTTGRIDEIDVTIWDEIIDITLKGSSNCCRSVIPAMRANGGGFDRALRLGARARGDPRGRRVRGGEGGHRGPRTHLAVDHARESIRVNCIVPGSTDTPMMWLGIAPDKHDEARRMCEEDIPLARVADPLEIARPILFLASDDASFITGATLVADGGVLAKFASRL